MKEKKIDFHEILNPFDEGSSWKTFRSFSPTGRVPCLVDQDLVIWDSLAIAEYLAEQNPSLWPQEKGARAFARCISSEMHAGFMDLRNICTMNVGIRVRLHEHKFEQVKADIHRLEEIWSEGLQRFNGPFLAGSDFTIADAMFAPIAFRIQSYGLKMNPTCTAYAKHILSLASMREWQTSALQEKWREPHHENDARQSGEWLEDLRA